MEYQETNVKAINTFVCIYAMQAIVEYEYICPKRKISLVSSFTNLKPQRKLKA